MARFSKNAATVAVVTDPADYAFLLAERVDNGEGSTRRAVVISQVKAFAHTRSYDSTIIEWASAAMDEARKHGEKSDFATIPRTWDKAAVLRYGENSHKMHLSMLIH